MRENLGEHVDPETEEVCCTTLAEDCANALYDRAAGELDFEIAHEIACEFEIAQYEASQPTRSEILEGQSELCARYAEFLTNETNIKRRKACQ